ncbi:MAG TPA: hypothetical protein QGF35_07125 [Dehalococcoidia bacterium]|nr:hypothetical protein [Dehalococcoidia bacterium]
MKLGIAGYGNIGRYVAGVFATSHEIVAYDPPKSLGSVKQMNDCEWVFIAVPTPALPDGRCDTRAVEEVVATVSPRGGFICHSTVAIGTTERLTASYGKRIVFVPEFAGEAPDHLYRNIENRTFFILGGDTASTAEIETVFASVYGASCRFSHVSPREAEIVKYMENAFLALKVTFCNEMFDLSHAFDVDFERVRELWVQDGRVGESHTVVTPERGFGGMCLPKDVAALCFSAREVGSPLKLLERARDVNRRIRGGARQVLGVGS